MLYFKRNYALINTFQRNFLQIYSVKKETTKIHDGNKHLWTFFVFISSEVYFKTTILFLSTTFAVVCSNLIFDGKILRFLFIPKEVCE